MAESNLRRALTLSEGDVGIFVTRPISLLFLVLTAASFLWPLVTWLRGDKNKNDPATPPEAVAVESME